MDGQDQAVLGGQAGLVAEHMAAQGHGVVGTDSARARGGVEAAGVLVAETGGARVDAGALPSELKNTKMALLTLGDGRPKWKSALQQHMTEAIAMARKSLGPPPSRTGGCPTLQLLARETLPIVYFGPLPARTFRTASCGELHFVLAQGLRTLFNRGETVVLLNTLDEAAGLEDRPYWQKVLSYSADGNLQAVLDEYLFQLHKDRGGHELDEGPS